ncbi:MAG TPA: 16S rRNA (guanine(527)-N(7))-methyltransferase RsmG [Pirellulales bacterium]|nr:16S rRNA (guanine(527)-N(7))-methyltransferase RsmG [Pirellulales bacterium]
MTTNDNDTLSAALARHAIELPFEQIQELDRYCRLLWEWNTKLNLTRHTDYEKFVSRDMVDSLVISRHLGTSERVLDVGTGGGVPGIVLAVCRPDLDMSLCESVAKKAKVVEQIVAGLGLSLPVYHRRAEDLLAEKTFDTLVLRAVAPLAKLLTWFHDRWGAFDRLLAVKGPNWVAERQEAREQNLLKELVLRKLETWPLPGTSSESVLLEIRAKDAS